MLSREKIDALKALFPGYLVEATDNGKRLTFVLIPAHSHRVPSAGDVGKMLERMYGDVPTVAEDRTMWHYVTVEQDWTILEAQDGGTITEVFHGTRERAEDEVRNRKRPGTEVSIVEEW